MLTTPPRSRRRSLACEVPGSYTAGIRDRGRGGVAGEQPGRFDDRAHPVHAPEPTPDDPALDDPLHDPDDLAPAGPAPLAARRSVGAVAEAVDLLTGQLPTPAPPVDVDTDGGTHGAAGDRTAPDRSVPDGAVSASVSGGVGLPEHAQLARLVATLRAADRLTAEAVRLAGQLDATVVVAEEGMASDTALRLHAGITRTDTSTVLNAADVLASMPVTAGLFACGVLSWGHVRALTAGARRLDTTTRHSLDGYLAAQTDRLRAADGEGQLGVIDDALALHTPTRQLEDAAERDHQARCLIITPRLDGSGTIFSDLDLEGFATVTGRLDHEADTPLADPSPGDAPAGMPATARTGLPASRAQLLADALVRICEHARPTDAGGVPVRFTVIVDAEHVTDRLAATLQPAIAARPPRIVRRALDRLSCDAALDVVIRDGHDLLAARRYTPELTAATRRAIHTRDRGCRFPGCRAPVSWCDIHHVHPRAHHGDHHPANLVALCRRHHNIVHRRGWTQHLDPDGTYTITRNRRTWTTRPRLTDRLPPPTTSDPPGDPPTSDPPGSDLPTSNTRRGRRAHPADPTQPAIPRPTPF